MCPCLLPWCMWWYNMRILVGIHWLQLNLFSRVQCDVSIEPLV